MSCCGSKRQALALATPRASRAMSRSSVSARPAPALNTAPAPAAVLFVYRGGSSLNIRNPATGRLYVFDRPGASQRADAADVPWLAGFPWLQRADAGGFI